jgi:hypothetical protein
VQHCALVCAKINYERLIPTGLIMAAVNHPNAQLTAAVIDLVIQE